MKRWLELWGLIIVIGACVWGWAFFASAQRFPLSTVKVYQTPENVPLFAVRSAVLPFLSQGFFGVDIAQLQKVLKALPGVATVDVWREWPNRLMITFAPKSVTARWQKHDLVGPQAELFKQWRLPAANLPLLKGNREDLPAMIAFYQQLAPLLAQANLQIAQLSFWRGVYWTLQLKQGTQVILGQKKLLLRVKRFVAAWPTIASDKPPLRVDLRYANGLAVKPA